MSFKKNFRLLMGILACLIGFVSTWSTKALANDITLENWPIQDSGRIKPYDTFAREAMQLLYGKQTYKSRKATEVVLTWMLIPEYWNSIQFVQLSHAGVRQFLKIDKEERKYFSPQELLSNPRIALLFQQLRSLRTKGEKLKLFYQEAQRLENQLTMLRAIQGGYALAVWPDLTSENKKWKTVQELDDSGQQAFSKITKNFVALAAGVSGDQQLSGEKKKEIVDGVNQAVQNFVQAAGVLKNVNMYKINAEVFYNKSNIFIWSWSFYIIASLLLLVNWFGASKKFQWAGWVFVAMALLLHTLGFALRIYISGRPPVSNMYETVIWVPWGTVIFASILERVYRKKLVLISACVVAALCLILSGIAPAVLDPSFQPLEAVLNSTFWLTTHVLVITISYGAFFLAWCVGNFVMVFTLLGEEKYKHQIKDASTAIYRASQIGVILLATGIILGGVWADYSWGRFWGWDPKETWALIALLGYLAILHARLTHLIRHFGMAACSIVSFCLVIMAWYGVNYVLGAGLHSYGFGAGGVEWVSLAVVIQILFVSFVALYTHKISWSTRLFKSSN